MTQAINFDDLKQAFAPVSTVAVVTSLHKGNASTIAQDNSMTALSDENKTLERENADLKAQLGRLQQAQKASSTQINYLTQEALKLEQDILNIHEDKMRLVRSQTQKQHQVEALKRELTNAHSDVTRLKVKLAHSKRDTQKQIDLTAQKTKENKAQLSLMKQMSNELTELKKQRSLVYVLRAKITKLLNKAHSILKTRLQQWFPKKSRSHTPKKPLVWIHVSKQLPTKQCTVFVRNGYESDMAVYYPATKRFKTINPNFNVFEWAKAE